MSLLAVAILLVTIPLTITVAYVVTVTLLDDRAERRREAAAADRACARYRATHDGRWTTNDETRPE